MYLTRRQCEMLKSITDFIKENGYSPTLEELAAKLQLKSLATVHKHLQNLEAKGYIKRNWNHSRSIEVVPQENEEPATTKLPLLGEVAAGAPIEVIETVEMIDAPPQFARRKNAFALKVCGDSMIEDGIQSGDLIIVEKQSFPQPGQTVVAMINGTEATVKRYYPQGDKIRLAPANRLMQPLEYHAANVEIKGVVIGLIRRY